MIALNYVEVPATEKEDINRADTVWLDGRCVSLNEGTHTTLFIGHREKEIYDSIPEDAEEAPQPRMGMEAFAVRVPNPVRRDEAINAAEMEAYMLGSPMEVASFNASLARKHRLDPSDPEVAEHDAFIQWVREELTKIKV